MLRSLTSLPRLPVRPKDGHKGTFGKVLIIAGSTGMSGAAVLCGLGALRSGAGLVQVACPQEIQTIVAAANPCYLTLGLPSQGGQLIRRAAEVLEPWLPTVQALAFGPGLGKSDEMVELLDVLLQQFQGPFVIDADGLHAMTQLRLQQRLKARNIPLICTPHPGELGQMLGQETRIIQSERKQQAVRYVTEHKVVLALKGQGTIVTDGQKVYVNTTGNPGMAKGGSGDVLTGIIS
ncbi:MAG TPA: NAD(P)H-hydrate dehydratase, partial [Gemmatales bacterium]|nr:NAD(P)H-hydrate dehydratase [Gemmatales bacterium]